MTFVDVDLVVDLVDVDLDVDLVDVDLPAVFLFFGLRLSYDLSRAKVQNYSRKKYIRNVDYTGVNQLWPWPKTQITRIDFRYSRG